MASHSLLAYRSDGNKDGVKIPLDSDAWPSYVPLRMATTICVQERLPSGAAGVLLNRSHRFHDLILAIDAQEKKIFDAIDGRRSIAEIMHHVGNDGSSDARIFFKKLWWYDQVTFDTSSSAWT